MKRISTIFLLVVFGIIALFGQVSNQIIEIEQPVWERIITPSRGISLSNFAEANGRMWTIDTKLVFSDDGGQSWQEHPTVIYNDITSVFAGDFGVVFNRIITDYTPFSEDKFYETYYSTDNGETFTKSNVLLYYTSTTIHTSSQSLGIRQKSSTELIELYSASAMGGPYYGVNSSEDGGASWDFHDIFSGAIFTPMSSMKFSLYNDTLSTLIQREDSTWFLGIYTDDYDTPSIDSFVLPETNAIASFRLRGQQLITFDGGGNIYSSNNLGQTWTTYNPGIESSSSWSIKYTPEELLIKTGTKLYSIHYNNLSAAELIYQSVTSPLITYAQSTSGILVSSPKDIFFKPIADQEFIYWGNGMPGASTRFHLAGDVIWVHVGEWYRSDDQGISWSLSPIDILNGNSQILSDYNDIFTLEKNNEIYQSTDNGITWQSVLSFEMEVEVIEQENGIFIYDQSQVYFSEDGINFIEGTHPSGNGKFIWHQDRLLYFDNNQRYSSDNNGLNWDPPEPTTGLNDRTLKSNNNQLINIQNIGIFGYIFHSNDQGLSWYENSLLYPLLFQFLDMPPRYLGMFEGMLIFNHKNYSFISADNGQHWARVYSHFSYRAGGNGYNIIKGPEKISKGGDFLYGIDDSKAIYRTSFSFLKNQLNDSIIIRDLITGNLYKDLNNNCLRDSMDIPIAHKVISIGGNLVTTNNDGWFNTYPQSNNSGIPYYTDSIRYHEHNCENTCEGIVQLNGDTLSIAFSPTNVPAVDGEVTAWTSGIFRPGANTQIRLKITNHGTVALTNENIIITYDPDDQNISANSDGMALSTNQWQIPFNLDPGASEFFTINLSLSTGISPNEELTYHITLPLTDDVYPADNQTTLTETIIASYDPNDKTAYEKTTLPYTQNEFIYRIRFQNTGNDTAFKVVILDTLPPELDIFTLEMLDASHPYELKIYNPVLRWTFRDILLPDSTTNEADSHGYLFFKIKTKDDLAITDTIKNSAAIYFDYNDPVITEQAITEIKKGYQETDIFFSACPGIEIDGTVISMDTTIITVDTTNQIYDLATNTIIEVYPSYNLDSLITLHPGDTILGIPVFSDTTIVYQGLTEMYGCDSIISFQIALLTNTEDLEQLSFTAQVQPNPTIVGTNLILNTTESIQTNILLYHLNGQNIKTILSNKIFSAGRHDVPISLEALPSGVYYLRVETAQRNEVLRIVKIE